MKPDLPTSPRRALLRKLASLAVVVAGLPACSQLATPRVITLSERELAALLARAFPVQQRWMAWLELQLSAPQLRLLPDTNRLSLGLAVQAQERLRGGGLRGDLLFDSALRYEPQDATVRLSQVRVQQLLVQPGADGAEVTGQGLETLPGGAQRLGRLMAEQLLENLVIYRLPDERLQQLRQLGLRPGAVTVTSRGVEITLGRLDG